MGFFSARRPEEYQQRLGEGESVVRVIRSRFYGKHTSKRRDAADSDSHQHSQDHSHVSAPTFRDSPSSPPSAGFPDTGRNKMPNPRTSTDAVTMTLAQRLNELAVANSQGLLDDDEYRLLRQSLFDRFAGGSSVPSELPLVPLTVGAQDNGDGKKTNSSHQRRPSSQFNAASTRTPSIQSKKTLTSTVAGLLKRATSRRRSSAMDSGKSDATSVFSFNSTDTRGTSLFRGLPKQTSVGSLRTEMSPFLHEADPSIPYASGLHTAKSSNSLSSDTRSRSTVRSARRAVTAPPSSYIARSISSERHVGVLDGSGDDQLLSAQDIRHEIELVEAEGRRLLDAFNGLELSTLVRQQKHTGQYSLSLRTTPPSSEVSWRASPSSAVPDKGSFRFRRDADATSIRSNGSSRTNLSAARSPSVIRRPPLSAVMVESGSLHRKNSISAVSTHSNTGPGAVGSSPLSARPSGRFRLGSSSSVNLTRSSGHLPLATVSETDASHRIRTNRSFGNGSTPASVCQTDSEAGESTLSEEFPRAEEMSEIRRRRAEVTARYEARLEYLRARLKGAELREKLMKT